MTEFEKLKHRLKNVRRNTTEYRMTVREARDLVEEIDHLLQEKPQSVVLSEPIVTKTRILDGGAF